MPNLEKAESVVGGLRQVIQDLVAPELRELKAEIRAINSRLDGMDGRLDRVDGRLDRLENTVVAGFEKLSRQLDTYNDVQVLKERMARVEGERSRQGAA